MLPTIAQVINRLPVGGAERVLVNLAKGLSEKGWNVRVVCLKEKGPMADELEKDGFPVDLVPVQSRLSPVGLRRVVRYLHQHDVKIVHTHMYRANTSGTVAARIAGVPAIFGHVHNTNTWSGFRQRLTARLIATQRTATFAVSLPVQDEIIRKLHLPESKVPLLINGVDINYFHAEPELGSHFRGEIGIPSDAVVFLVPARLHPNKNPIGTIDAFEKLLKALPPSSRPYLVFAGGGGMEEQVRNRIQSGDLAEHVRLLGICLDMRPVYNASDAIVMNGWKEGGPLTVVEALACGKPVLGSDCGITRDAVRPPQGGWVHQPGDTEALTAHMAEACKLGHEGLKAMAQDCRECALPYGLESYIDQVHAHYCKALGINP